MDGFIVSLLSWGPFSPYLKNAVAGVVEIRSRMPVFVHRGVEVPPVVWELVSSPTPVGA